MRLATFSALSFTAATFFVSSLANGAALDPNRSKGTTELSWSSRETIIGPTSQKTGASTLQVQVSANLDPLKDTTKPLLAVGMKNVLLDASWKDNKEIELAMTDNSNATDGSFRVQHTLAPHITIFINAFGFNLTYDYEAGDLIQYVPGSAWNYLGQGSGTFDPWGFKVAIMQVVGPPLANAQLFSMPLPNIGGGSSPLLTGTLSFNATTSPTFNYTTTEVVLDGGKKVDEKARTWKIPTTDADYLDVQAQVRGKITWSGNLFARPAVTITKIGDFTLPFPLTLEIAQAGIDMPYQSGDKPREVVFPTATFHVPLPNVKVLTKDLAMGASQIGKAVTKPADIKNTGEMGAVLSIASSNPAFTVAASDKTINAKDALALDITFTPTKEGSEEADITVTSNDPNEPVQVIHVNGTGTKVPVPPATAPADDNKDFGPKGDDGCGCRTAPSPTSSAAYVGLGLAALAVARRRRR
jgi:MYXO-CTERM domain-containing protein